MASSNPVSPKVIAGGLGSLILPAVLWLVTYILDLFTNGQIVLPDPWGQIVFYIAGAVGAVVAAYRKTDPLRLPTADPGAVAELADEEA